MCLVDAELTKDGIHLGDTDTSYKYGMYHDGILWASKDGNKFVIAVSVNS